LGHVLNRIVHSLWLQIIETLPPGAVPYLNSGHRYVHSIPRKSG
jgi:hypothetical protein